MDFAEKTSVVLGGRGFIGSHLIDLLLQRGSKVKCFDRPLVQPVLGAVARTEGLSFIDGDFTSKSDVMRAIAGCDYCFHLVSTTVPKSSNDDPVYDVESNLLSTVKMLEDAVAAGVRKIIFASSGGTVYGIPERIPIAEQHPTNPVCSYGISKLATEKYLELFRLQRGLEYGVVRLANPFGERQRTEAAQGAVAVFLAKALRAETIEIWGDGSVVRDYIHISDVVEAMAALALHEGGPRVFNIGSGTGTSINTLLDKIETVLGSKVRRKYMSARPFDVPVNVLDIELAQSALGWSPRVTFDEGLQRSARWLQNELKL
ncbi:MAG TPA: NAD-dependent epimerase/dehydratase family protein [Caldimonas sp.]|nr:NAD-dependent epimerase/dehydratase family protein [Caldimonas sp.]HEX2542199.1 NAD-dependent epimerase/dehydratase family protein [Caldimonas sp.]